MFRGISFPTSSQERGKVFGVDLFVERSEDTAGSGIRIACVNIPRIFSGGVYLPATITSGKDCLIINPPIFSIDVTIQDPLTVL
jgi:hypothetical protein